MKKLVFTFLALSTMASTIVLADDRNSGAVQINIEKETVPGGMQATPRSSSTEISSDAIINDVKTVLLGSFRKYVVKVTVFDGTVTLRGAVDSQEDKDKIEDVVKKVRGVKAVDNQLEVISK